MASSSDESSLPSAPVRQKRSVEQARFEEVVLKLRKYKSKYLDAKDRLRRAEATAHAVAVDAGAAAGREHDMVRRKEGARASAVRQSRRADNLKGEVEKQQMELRELRYRNLHLARELAQARDAAESARRLAREAGEEATGRLRAAEGAVVGGVNRLRGEHEAAQALVRALEQHTQRGLHVAPSHKVRGVVSDLWRVLAALATGLDSLLRAVSTLPAHGAAPPGRRRRAVERQGSGDGATDPPLVRAERRLLSSAVTELYEDMEAENRQLRAKMQALEGELARAQEEAKLAELVPDYRVAVVKARSQAAVLRESLAEETARAAKAEDRLREAEDRLRQQAARFTAMLEEQSGLRRQGDGPLHPASSNRASGPTTGSHRTVARSAGPRRGANASQSDRAATSPASAASSPDGARTRSRRRSRRERASQAAWYGARPWPQGQGTSSDEGDVEAPSRSQPAMAVVRQLEHSAPREAEIATSDSGSGLPSPPETSASRSGQWVDVVEVDTGSGLQGVLASLDADIASLRSTLRQT